MLPAVPIPARLPRAWRNRRAWWWSGRHSAQLLPTSPDRRLLLTPESLCPRPVLWLSWGCFLWTKKIIIITIDIDDNNNNHHHHLHHHNHHHHHHHHHHQYLWSENDSLLSELSVPVVANMMVVSRSPMIPLTVLEALMQAWVPRAIEWKVQRSCEIWGRNFHHQSVGRANFVAGWWGDANEITWTMSSMVFDVNYCWFKIESVVVVFHLNSC